MKLEIKRLFVLCLILLVAFVPFINVMGKPEYGESVNVKSVVYKGKRIVNNKEIEYILTIKNIKRTTLYQAQSNWQKSSYKYNYDMELKKVENGISNVVWTNSEILSFTYEAKKEDDILPYYYYLNDSDMISGKEKRDIDENKLKLESGEIYLKIQKQNNDFEYDNDFEYCSTELYKAGSNEASGFSICIKRENAVYSAYQKYNNGSIKKISVGENGNWNSESTYKQGGYAAPRYYYYNENINDLINFKDLHGLYVYYEDPGMVPDASWKEYWRAPAESFTPEEDQEQIAEEIYNNAKDSAYLFGKCLVDNNFSKIIGNNKCNNYLNRNGIMAGMTEEETRMTNISQYGKCISTLADEDEKIKSEINKYCIAEYDTFKNDYKQVEDYVGSTGNSELINKYQETIGFDFTFTDLQGCDMFGSLMPLIREVFIMIQSALGIGLVILTAMEYIGVIVSSEEDKSFKKANKHFVIRIGIIVALFLVPAIVKFLMEQIGLGEYFCWY